MNKETLQMNSLVNAFSTSKYSSPAAVKDAKKNLAALEATKKELEKVLLSRFKDPAKETTALQAACTKGFQSLQKAKAEKSTLKKVAY